MRFQNSLLLLLCSVNEASAFLTPQSAHPASPHLLMSPRNDDWDPSRYERYDPRPQQGYDGRQQGYERGPRDEYYDYNNPQQPPEYRYNNDGPTPPPRYDYNDDNYQDNNGRNNNYNRPPPPPQQQDYYANRDRYGNYQDRQQPFQDRRNYREGERNSQLTPYDDYRDNPQQRQRYDNYNYYEYDRRDDRMMPRRYQRSRGIFDEFNQMFERMSPFGRARESLLSPLRDSFLFQNPFLDFSSFGDRMMPQEDIQPVLQDAERFLIEDEACAAVLGPDIQMGQVVSRSSASSSVNGAMPQQRLQMSVRVQGSRGEGIVKLLANENGMEQMLLQTQEGELDVRLPGGGARPNNNNNRLPPPNNRQRYPNDRRRMDPNNVIIDTDVVPENGDPRDRGLPPGERNNGGRFPDDW